MGVYLTPGEYTYFAQTGVDLSTFIKGGNAVAQTNVLREQIARAGAWIDNEVNQPLLAGRYVDIGRIRCTRDGWIFRPRTCQLNLTLISLEIGPSISGLSTLSLTDAYVDSRQFVVPGSTPFGLIQLGGVRPGAKVVARAIYNAGWASTTLTGTTYAPGVTAVTVADATGIVAGLKMWLVDGTSAALTEQITVSSVAGSTVNFTTTPLVNSYTVTNEVGLTAMPRDLRLAAAHVTSMLLKSRGADGLNLTTLNAPAPQQQSTAGGLNLYTARQILHPSYDRIA